MYILTESDVSTYLHFGYLPDSATKFSDLFDEWPRIEEGLRLTKESPPKLLMQEGVQLLKSVFKNVIADTSENHVLPLSGGLDSRAILCGLLENVNSHEIQAVTFGSRGTWDFEIGQQVARAAGVRCEPLDLTAESWKWDTNELVETAKQTARPVLIFGAFVNRAIALRFGTESVFWSGFMANALDGDHIVQKHIKEHSASWNEAKKHFIVLNRYANSVKLTPPNFEPENCLPAAPLADHTLVSYDDQIYFAVRDQCFLRHTVLPAGYEYRTPFLHPEWVRFTLGVPGRYRGVDRWLFKEILKTAYSQLFSLPIKPNFRLPPGEPMLYNAVRARRAMLRVKSVGRRLFPTMPWGLDPMTNYIDFNEGLRERKDIKDLVYENLQDLKKRNIIDWLDVDLIWKRHQRKQANHADALILLASLEIHMKAGEAANH
jgi:hypothetical protein